MSLAAFALLLGLVALISAGVIWLIAPASTTSMQSTAQLSAPPAVGAAEAVVSAASGMATVAAPVLQMAEGVAAPAPTSPAEETSGRLAEPTAVPTLRQWDVGGSGIVSDPALVARLDRALIGVDGSVSVAVKDLASDRGAVLDGDRELPAASLYKLPVLYTVFEAGLRMSEEIPITDEAIAYDAGTMELGPGETLTVAEALERMITISDNTAAVMLGSRVGGWRINGALAALGMDRTHYSLERMTTSGLDMLHLLELIARGKAVSVAASADMVNLMLRQRVNDRLPRLLPGDVHVAHKTGNLPGTVNDVGILFGPTSTLAVAVLISDTSDDTTAAAGIARVAATAYAYFDEQPADGTPRPLAPRAPTRPIPPVWREPKPTPTPTEEPTPEAAAQSAGATPTVTPARVVTPEAPTSKPTPVPAAQSATATPVRPAPPPTPVQSTQMPTHPPAPTPVKR